MNQSFPKSLRLLNAKDFAPVFKQPTFRVSSSSLLILALSTNKLNSRLGIVVAKKNIPTAVQRNKIKRVIRESFRTKQIDFATIDLVVLAKKNLNDLENLEIQTQINILFDELCSRLVTKTKLGIKTEEKRQ